MYIDLYIFAIYTICYIYVECIDHMCLVYMLYICIVYRSP